MVSVRMAAVMGVFSRLGAALFALSFALCGGAFAQQSGTQGFGSDKSQRLTERRESATLLQWGAFGLDLSAGPDQRPRRSLRIRFDAATQAMRSFGIEAEECATVVRTTSSRASLVGGGTGSLQLGMAFALNCRFF